MHSTDILIGHWYCSHLEIQNGRHFVYELTYHISQRHERNLKSRAKDIDDKDNGPKEGLRGRVVHNRGRDTCTLIGREEGLRGRVGAKHQKVEPQEKGELPQMQDKWSQRHEEGHKRLLDRRKGLKYRIDCLKCIDDGLSRR